MITKSNSNYVNINHRLVEPGMKMWFIRNKNKPNIEETVIEKIVLKKTGWYFKLACNSMYETSCSSIGKTMFFDKKDAESKAEEYSSKLKEFYHWEIRDKDGNLQTKN